MGQLSTRIKFKTVKQAMGQHRHNDRSKVPSYSDPSRIGMNKILKAFPTETYTKRNGDEVIREVSLRSMAEDIESSYKEAIGRKWQSNSCHFIDGILTFSSSADLSDKDALDACALKTMDAIIKQHALRDDALIEMVRHEDETRPHYHFMLKNQRLDTTSARRSFDRDACAELQDLAGDAFSSMGIHRGTPKQERIDNGEPIHKYINRTVKQLHEDLPREVAEAETELDRCSLLTLKAEKHLDRVQSTTKRSEKKLDKVQLKTSNAQQALNVSMASLDNNNAMLISAEAELADAERLKVSAKSEAERLKALQEKLTKESTRLQGATKASGERLALVQSEVELKEKELRLTKSELSQTKEELGASLNKLELSTQKAIRLDIEVEKVLLEQQNELNDDDDGARSS
ncbi:MAG: hypothetical protein A6F70_03925 [Cycloclasticus sp. symbiont of Bathymodiolus heckerae]|nr:MAG: hypothetical protein A6F70_03925 [Cycloclasticus sp. symbiont of Bathymodiolus heckerae]